MVRIAGGNLIEHAPVLYQMRGNAREPVAGAYMIDADQSRIAADDAIT